MFYIGSCRYMYGFKWEYFPCRLHTTKEIIYFLQNINKISEHVNRFPKDLCNTIFGGIHHKNIQQDVQQFIKHQLNKNHEDIIIEVCSRKVFYYKNIPLNFFYVQNDKNVINRYELKYKEISDSELTEDIEIICEMIKKLFQHNTRLQIIPHLNLKSKINNSYIESRYNLTHTLKDICLNRNIKFYDLEELVNNRSICKLYLEDFMEDGLHYSKNYDIIKSIFV